jgi:predicted PurR-regulated permease PerM
MLSWRPFKSHCNRLQTKQFVSEFVTKYMTKLQRCIYILLFFILSFAGLYFSGPFLIPVTLAAVFSMLFVRFCNWLEHKEVSRGLASLLCVCCFIFAICLILFLLSWQINGLLENLDAMKQRMVNLFSDLQHWIYEKAGIDLKQQKEIIKDQSASSEPGNMLASFARQVTDILVNAVLVVVYMFLFLLYRSHIKKFILKLVPGDEKSKADGVVHLAGNVAQRYLSGLAAMIAVLWMMYGIGFSIVGVKGAIFFAVLCGILEIVPFIGNLTGTLVTMLSVLAQGGDSKMIIGVLITYALVQFIQTYILEPLIVGEQVNINPLFTILAIVLGELVWGVAGMILAIPLLGMLKIVCDHIPDLQPYGFLIGTEKQKNKKTGFIDKIKLIFNNS